MEKLEIEVKFFLPDRPSLREDILDLGARSSGRFFEKNLRFEDPDKTLKSKQCLLRLRHDHKTTLTYKSKPGKGSQQFKVFKELEVEVSEFKTMNDILELLGFHVEQIYEKWRETLILENTLFCLDTMPYGQFLEIEGSQKDIKLYARRLGLEWNKRILTNYLEIFEIIKEKMDLKFMDVTFDNFKDIDVRLQDFARLIEAGD